MVRWKFKAFIILYSTVLIVLVVMALGRVWKILDNFQDEYDAEVESSDYEKIIEDYVSSFNIDSLLKLVENDSGIYITEFEEMDVVKSLYKRDYENCVFTYKEDSEYCTESKKVYSLFDENEEKIVTVILLSEGRTEQFGFRTWEIEEIILDKYYEAKYSVVIRVADDSRVLVNGVEITGNAGYESVEDEEFDNVFAEAVTPYTGHYDKYTYYSLMNFYETPDIRVIKEGVAIEPAVAADGTYNYESFEEAEFVDSIREGVIFTESLYADYIARFKEWEELEPYLRKKTDFYKTTYNAKSFLQFVNRPKDVTYSNWNITSVKKYKNDMITCDISYIQRVDYGGIIREYINTARALFAKNGDTWQLIYQKNR